MLIIAADERTLLRALRGREKMFIFVCMKSIRNSVNFIFSWYTFQFVTVIRRQENRYEKYTGLQIESENFIGSKQKCKRSAFNF